MNTENQRVLVTWVSTMGTQLNLEASVRIHMDPCVSFLFRRPRVELDRQRFQQTPRRCTDLWSWRTICVVICFLDDIVSYA